MTHRTFCMTCLAALGLTTAYAVSPTSTALQPASQKIENEWQQANGFQLSDNNTAPTATADKPSFVDVGGNLKMVSPQTNGSTYTLPAGVKPPPEYGGPAIQIGPPTVVPVPPGSDVIPKGTPGYPNGGIVVPGAQPKRNLVPQNMGTVPQPMQGVPHVNPGVPQPQLPPAASPVQALPNNITPGTTPGGHISN